MVNKEIKEVAYNYAGEHTSVKEYKRLIMECEKEAFIAGVNYVRDKLMGLYGDTKEGDDISFEIIDKVIFGNENRNYLDKEWIKGNLVINKRNGSMWEIGKFEFSEFQNRVFEKYLGNDLVVIDQIRQCGVTKLLGATAICEALNGKKVLFMSENFDSAELSKPNINFNKLPIECEKLTSKRIVFENGGSIVYSSDVKEVFLGCNYDVIILDLFMFYDNSDEILNLAMTNKNSVPNSKLVISIMKPNKDSEQEYFDCYNKILNVYKDNIIKAGIDDTFADVNKFMELFGEEKTKEYLAL